MLLDQGVTERPLVPVELHPVLLEHLAARTGLSQLLPLGGTPGKAYEPGGWEVWAPLHPLYQAGKYDEAADRGRELIEAHPEYAGVAYNVACVESLAGRKEDALGHLRHAIERREQFRKLAARDSDFDPIREESAFKELVS